MDGNFWVLAKPGNRQPATGNGWSRDLYFITIMLVCAVLVIYGSMRGNLGRKANEGNKQFSNPLSDTFRSKFDHYCLAVFTRVYGYRKIFAAHVWTFLLWTELRSCTRSQIYSASGVLLSSRKKSLYFWRGSLTHRFILMFSSLKKTC